MFKPNDEKASVLQDFHANPGGQKDTFMRVQRFLWEKSLFPERFPRCSVFLCAKCNCRTHTLSFCLQCGRCFCLAHFGEHACPPGFGVDVGTHQLFLFKPGLGRCFLFDASIDRLVISAKLAELDGLPLSAPLDPKGPVLPVPRPPIQLPNLGPKVWMGSLLQCLVANPLLQKWFLSGSFVVNRVDRPEAAVHLHLQKLLMAQMREGAFSLVDFMFAAFQMSPTFATSDEYEPHEFFIDMKRRMDAFYQEQFDTAVFSMIYGWMFKVILSCDSCDETKTLLESARDVVLPTMDTTNLSDMISRYLLEATPGKCGSCGKLCKRQLFFNSLPATFMIALTRPNVTDQEPKLIHFDEELVLDDFLDIDKKQELGSARYQLAAMVVRPGPNDNGHYSANVRRWGQWFKCSDDNIQPIDVHDVLKSDACVLFFTRAGVVPQ